MITTKVKHITEKNNFNYLLGSFIFLLFSSACVNQFFSTSLFAHSFNAALTIISMTVSLWSFREERRSFIRNAIGLVIGIVVTTILIMLFDKPELKFLQIILILLFYLLILKIVAKRALFSGNITSNNVVGSICIFIILGMIWVMLYILLSELITDSFTGIQEDIWLNNIADFTYFSFVTLTTLGYGDILAVTPTARFLTYMEAIVGVFYMAIVVSSLVGAALTNTQHKRD